LVKMVDPNTKPIVSCTPITPTDDSF
jgi:hypothetical protein